MIFFVILALAVDNISVNAATESLRPASAEQTAKNTKKQVGFIPAEFDAALIWPSDDFNNYAKKFREKTLSRKRGLNAEKGLG